jgi:putative component of membrane protein insertase Oxa1/YidC/SpoIIIJ protein YidD
VTSDDCLPPIVSIFYLHFWRLFVSDGFWTECRNTAYCSNQLSNGVEALTSLCRTCGLQIFRVGGCSRRGLWLRTKTWRLANRWGEDHRCFHGLAGDVDESSAGDEGTETRLPTLTGRGDGELHVRVTTSPRSGMNWSHSAKRSPSTEWPHWLMEPNVCPRHDGFWHSAAAAANIPEAPTETGAGP